MLTGLPAYVHIIFFLAVALTFLLFIASTKNKRWPGLIMTGWLAITGLLAFNGFFKDVSSMPPKFLLAVVPAILFIIFLFNSKKGKNFIDSLDLRTLTLLHMVRVPVELVLYWLAAGKAVPELMTFAGKNFDIFSGITAPIIYFLCFNRKEVKNRLVLLGWNIICLALLLNIVITAALSVPFTFQQFAHEQPNIAVLYFPFTWLPSFIVMVVLLSHLTAIRRILKK
jgi:hypothetical protein